MKSILLCALAITFTSSAFAASRNSSETVALESRYSKTRIVSLSGRCERLLIKLERADGRILNLFASVNEAGSVIVSSGFAYGRGTGAQMKVGEIDASETKAMERACRGSREAQVRAKLYPSFSVAHRRMVEKSNSSASGRCGFNVLVGLHCSKGYSYDYQTAVDDFVVSAAGNRLNVRVKNY